MPNYLHSSSTRRVQNWLDSMHYFSPTSDEEKSSFASNKSLITKNSSNLKNQSLRSRKSSLSSNNNSSTPSTLSTRRILDNRRSYLRKPRILYTPRRLRRNLKKRYSDQSSSYFSGNTTDESSNLFSNCSVFMNDNSSFSKQKLPAEIKADDLEFENKHKNLDDENISNCSSSYYSNNNQHSFGILEFEQWDNTLKLNDEIEFKFKVKTYAFDLKDIKIKIDKKLNLLIVIGKQTIEEDDGYYKREFCKKFKLPANADTCSKNIKYDFDKNDHLVINVPKKIYSIH